MKQITATELKENLGKYLTLVHKEEILITKNGVPIAQLSPPKGQGVVSKLVGIIPDDGYRVDDARKERLECDESPDRH